MTRVYETLYIVDPNLTDEQVQAIMDKYRQLVEQTGGEVSSVEKWDKRRLAYEVAERREGIYVLMYFSGEAKVAWELDRVMRISEDVMRHLIVLEEAGQAAAAKGRVSKPEATKPEEAPKPAAEEAEVEKQAEAPAEAEAEAIEAAETFELAEAVETAELAEAAEPAETVPAEASEEQAEESIKEEEKAE
ncbi:MAG: 30S ribosomal protein S6 [Armatimonadetes bacterium]|nr:30S ribosomal protein S6 [Armatimonadota bacterium]